MTIPIMPGPWSFLGTAGEAAGSFLEARRQRQMFEQQQAQQNATLLANLVAKGLVDPGAFATAPNQQLLQTAGFPVGIQPGQVRVPKEQQEALGFGQEISLLPPGSPQRQTAFGVPTKAKVDIEAGQGALGREQVLARENQTPEQARLGQKVVAPGAAPIIERGQTIAAQAQNQQEEFNKQLWQGIRGRYAGDKEFSKIADYAAVHGLGWLTSQNEMWARLGSERAAQNTAQIRLITTVHNQAAQSYRAYYAIWKKGLEDEIERQVGSLSPGAGLKGKEREDKINEIIKNYTDHNKPRSLSDFVDDAIRDNYDADKGDYNAAVRSVAGGIAAQAEANMREMQRRYKSGEYTDADLEADPGLTPEQRAKIRSGDLLLKPSSSVKTKTTTSPRVPPGPKPQ